MTKEQMLKDTEKYILKLSWRFGKAYGVLDQLEDLQQSGRLGALKGFKNWKGGELMPYLYHWIRAEVNNECKNIVGSRYTPLTIDVSDNGEEEERMIMNTGIPYEYPPSLLLELTKNDYNHAREIIKRLGYVLS